MKLTAAQIQALLDAGSSVSVRPNADASNTAPKKNTLEVDTDLTVAAGKTLDLQSGIDVEVNPGKTLQVDGTLTADALQNNGTTTVTSGNTLRLRGNLTTAGTLTVTSTGRVVVDGTFTSTGTVTLASGATVLAKTFAPGAAPSGWEVSAEADADGYYSLIPAETPPPPPPAPITYTITFSANGGTLTGPATMQTSVDGKLASWPTIPTYGDLSHPVEVIENPGMADPDHAEDAPPSTPRPDNELEFLGWFDAPVNGTKITDEYGNPISDNLLFTSDTPLYAHWDGWFIDDARNLVIAGSGDMDNYSPCSLHLSYVDQPFGYTSAPWGYEGVARGVNKIEIKEGITSIGDYAFYEMDEYSIGGPPATVLTSISIPDSVTSIGDFAFFGCSGLTSVSIPGSVTSIGKSIFEFCYDLTNINVAAANPSYSAVDGVLFNKDQTVLIQCPAGLDGTYVIPSSVVSIGEYAFSECGRMTGITIQEGVKTIGKGAFSGCSGLTSITIPSSVDIIGPSAFQYCMGIEKIFYGGTVDGWQTLMDASPNIYISSGLPVHCSDGETTT